MKVKKILLSLFTTTIFISMFYSISQIDTPLETFASYSPPSGDNKRIWFTANSNASWWFGSSNTRISWWIGANYFDSGTSYMTQLAANGFYYYDIPSSSTMIQFRRVKSDDSNVIYNYSDTYSISINDEYYLYEVNDATSGGSSNNDNNLTQLNQFTASNFENKLNSYLTCSNSFDGFADVPYLRMGFYDSMRESERTNFFNSTTVLDDYDYDEFVSNGNSYDGLTQSIEDGAIPRVKWHNMEQQYIEYIDSNYPLSFTLP